MSSATSIDGRAFHFEVRPDARPAAGAFVTLTTSDGVRRLGQVLDSAPVEAGLMRVSGRVLGDVASDGAFRGVSGLPFAGAEVLPADDATIDRVYAASGAHLSIGTLEASPGVPARLLPKRFNRHTFWCGQSGSGKTYALGVVLEELLLHTELPMVVFDPNSDFVRLRELRTPRSAEAVGDGSAREALAGRDIRIRRPPGTLAATQARTTGTARTADTTGATGTAASGAAAEASVGPALVRFTELRMRSKAAVLGIDPLVDREEYNALLHYEGRIASSSPEQIVVDLQTSADPAARALALRIENLRLMDWELWAGDEEAITDTLDRRPDALILDVGGFTYPDEHLVVALAVLDRLWADREQRRPVLIVIDEAHNFAGPEAESPLARAVRDRILQIAAEGRKFGLWLLLSTQRPSKVHPGILSQCDNLALMKMSSPVDLDELASVFGYAPTALLERSPLFRQGEALFAGGFVPAPTIAQMRERLTEEGGADVPVPLR